MVQVESVSYSPANARRFKGVAAITAAVLLGGILVAMAPVSQAAAEPSPAIGGTSWCDSDLKLRYDSYDSNADASERTFNGGYNGAQGAGPRPPVVYGYIAPSPLWTDIVPGDDDFTWTGYSLGFPFKFMGQSQTELGRNANGLFLFPVGAAYELEGSWEPQSAGTSAAQPNNWIAPLWVDLDPGRGGTFGIDVTPTYVVGAWDDMQVSLLSPVPPGQTPPKTPGFSFEVMLTNAPFPDTIEYHYKQVYGINQMPMSVGFEDATGTKGNSLRYGVNAVGSNTAGWANYAIRMVPVYDVAPVAVNDTFAATEDTVLTIGAGTQPSGNAFIATDGVLGNDQDELACMTKTVELVANVAPAAGAVNLLPTGGFTYTPAANFCGAANFRYKVLDPIGGAGTSALTSNTANVTLNVTCVDDGGNAPVADNQTASTPKDTAITITVTGSDADGDALTFSKVSNPAHGTLSAFTQVTNSSATVVFTPTWGYCDDAALDAFQFMANDGLFNSAPATVEIAITCLPAAPPTANQDTYYVTVNTTLDTTATGRPSVLQNDLHFGGGTFTATLCSDVPAGQGMLSGGLASNGHFTFIPAGTSSYTTSFTYRAEDAAGQSACTAVTIKVQPNQPPVAHFSATPGTVQIGEPVTFVDASHDEDQGDGIASVAWTFGDGATSTATGPVHAYGNVGSYKACLVAQDARGNSSKPACATITVIAATGPSTPQAGAPVESSPQPAGSTDADETPIEISTSSRMTVFAGTQVKLSASADASSPAWEWTQTYGTRVAMSGALGSSPSFAAPGTPTFLYFEVEATQGDRAGVSGVLVEVVAAPTVANESEQDPPIIGPVPNVAFQTSVSGATVTVLAPGWIAEGTIAWDFGDGTVVAASDGEATHTYAAPGSYDITMAGSSLAGSPVTFHTVVVIAGAADEAPVVDASAPATEAESGGASTDGTIWVVIAVAAAVLLLAAGSVLYFLRGRPAGASPS